MEHTGQPQWQPISRLPFNARQRGRRRNTGREHLALLEQARGAYRINNADLARIVATWTQTRTDLVELFAEQGAAGRPSTSAPPAVATSNGTFPGRRGKPTSSNASSPWPTNSRHGRSKRSWPRATSRSAWKPSSVCTDAVASSNSAECNR